MTNETFSKELAIHGAKWESAHGGYFSSQDVARPYINAIFKIVSANKPDTIADIGGGTGFILRSIKNRLTTNIELIDIDLSEPQLCEAASAGIKCLKKSIEEMKRADLVMESGRLMLIMRSVLHYLGKAGQPEYLRLLRGLLNKKEYFIHQTICNRNDRDAYLLNWVYEKMGIDKWYYRYDELANMIRASDFEIIEVCDAEAGSVKSDELQTRYKLTGEHVASMCRDMASLGLRAGDILELTGTNSFRYMMDFKIFSCRAC